MTERCIINEFETRENIITITDAGAFFGSWNRKNKTGRKAEYKKGTTYFGQEFPRGVFFGQHVGK